MHVLLITANRLGDAILTTGVVRWLVERYPRAQITVACGALSTPLFEAMPEVNEVWPLVKKKWAGHWRELWGRAALRRWRHIVDLRGSGFAYTVWAGHRTVVGKDRELRHRILHLTEALGADKPLKPYITWSSEDAAEAEAELALCDKPLLAVGPTANWQGKQWPAERFGKICNWIVSDRGILPGAKILVAGAPSEDASLAPLFDMLSTQNRVDAFGWRLPVLAAALSQAGLYLGNDSGLMHLAAGVGTPTVGLFGPSRPERYAPWGLNNLVIRTPATYEEIVTAPTFDYKATESLMLDLLADDVIATINEWQIKCLFQR